MLELSLKEKVSDSASILIRASMAKVSEVFRRFTGAKIQTVSVVKADV